MNEKNQNVNVEIADEKLAGVVGGAQDNGAAAETRVCPHCGAKVAETAFICPECKKSISSLGNNGGSLGNRFG